ncbi:MAG TPA: pitrilysin family protein [Polyangiaceae bacterium]|jgi:zinc protease|nr:pitrilysin family protein [Polyangiaceae bacterium]
MTTDYASVAAKLSASRPEGRRLRHVASEPFGPGMTIERFQLDNGLTVLVERDNSAPVVSLMTWVKVGSRFEKEGKTGISHLFEHLMFGETEVTPHGAFDRQIEEAGGETNAATFLDWTYYVQNLPTSAVGLGMRLEAERMARLVLREPQVASEKDVVMNERRQRVEDDVDGAVSEALYREAFKVHAYGIPTIGWMRDIESFTPDDCTAFYKTYYAPNNATLVLSGDVEPERDLATLLDTFGLLSPSEIPVEDVHPEPPQIEERMLVLEKPTSVHRVAIGYKAPAFGDFEHAAMVVLAEILFGGRSGRIHKKLVREKEIASEARGWVGTFRDPSLFDIGLTAREGTTAEELLGAFDAELDKVLEAPVTDDELERAKARLELGTVQSLETAPGRAETIGFYETVLGDPGAIFGKLDAYRRVTKSDVLRAARRFLVKTSRTVVLVHPSGEPSEELDEEDSE